MATNLLWFVMAGFLLGFATSTLWEWFYFRKERLKLTDRRIRELEAKLREPETTNEPPSPANAIPTVASVTGSSGSSSSRTSAWGDTAYRSPGVFLESEELRADGEDNAAMGRERARASLTNTPTPGTPPIGLSSTTVPPIANNVTPVASTPPPIMPTESPIIPRSDQTPADALRAKRGDSPRSRQEVLAALRRNSEAAQRGQLPRAESEAPPPERLADSSRSMPLRASTLVSATPSTNEQGTGEEEVPAAPPPVAPPQPVASPVAAVPPARQRWANNPELTQRTQEYPDDLSKIKGIGDVYKQRLYKAGIYTWKQIAEGDIESLRRATSAYPSSNVEEWLVQAHKLMEKHGRKHAVYSGPQPDEMTKILGIGPVGAAVLYRAGICTFEQLASTSIEDLEALFPVAVAGDQPDFAQWVARATELADEKHRT